MALRPLICTLTTISLFSQTPDSPLTKSHYGYISADFIYWVANQQGNDYAVTGAAITVPGTVDPNTDLIPSTLTQSGSVYSPNFKIKPGFKVAIGLDVMQTRWNLFAEYTYLYSKASSSVFNDNINTGILPLYNHSPNNSILSTTISAINSGATGYVSQADSLWRLNFNNLSLELEKKFAILNNFFAKPHFGFQGSLQKQHFSVLYKVSSLETPTTILGTNSVNFKQTYWGFGPRVGLDGTWQCLNHFALFSNSGFSLLWSQFNGEGTSHDTNTPLGYSNLLISSINRKINTLIPVMQLSVGAQTNWISKDNFYFLLEASWEGQVWFNQNQRSTSISDISLFLQGLTLSAKLGY